VLAEVVCELVHANQLLHDALSDVGEISPPVDATRANPQPLKLFYHMGVLLFPFAVAWNPPYPGEPCMQQGTASLYEHESPTTLHKFFKLQFRILFFSHPILHKKYKTIPASLFMCIKYTPNKSSTNSSKIIYKIPDFFCPTLDTTIQKNASV
jgi:hypothetical protein